MSKPFDPWAHMKSQGWEKGKGLGKQEGGIKEAIKPKLKMDTAGVGHDPAEQFTNHWWDHVYNSAAQSMKVSQTQDKIAVEKVGDWTISTKRPKVANKLKNKSLLYGNFVKSATLENGIMEKSEELSDSSDSDSEHEAPKAFGGLTDEQLLAACGGRTAHKGARHGHKMNGKLARIEAAEALMDVNEASQSDSRSSNSSDDVTQSLEEPVTKAKKKKTKKSKSKDQEQSEIEPSNDNISTISKKKKKRKRDQTCLEVAQTVSNINGSNENETSLSTTSVDFDTESHTNSCKKKRKKDSEKQKSNEIEMTNSDNTIDLDKSKKKKKNKNKDKN